jgi:O-antigen ligase
MRQFLLISLFSILLADVMLGLGLSLGPGLSLKNAMLYVLFMALVLEFLLTDRDPLRETWPLHGAWALLIFYATFTWLAIVLLGLHREYETVPSFIALKGQLADLFLFLLVYLYGPRDALKSLKVLRWLIALLVFVNLITLIDFFNIPDLGVINERRDGRITGPVQEVNQYGAILIVLIPVTVGLMLSSSGALKLLYALGAAMAVILLGLTVSRGSYVGLAVGATIALYLARDHVRKEAIAKGSIVAVVVIAVAALSVAIVNPEGFLGKFSFAGADLNDLSSGRVDVWRRLLTKMSYWPVSFLTGYGWNAYRALIGIYGDPHNTYLLYWFNLGLIGLGLYLFIAIWIIRFSVKSLYYISEGLKPLVIGFITAFTAVHVAVFFVAIYTPWLFIWALAGTILRIIVDDRRNTQIATDQGNEQL